MVRSILDETINYNEIKTIAKEDINFDAVIYDTIIDNKERTLGVGQAQYTFIKKNIVYFPIYLILNGFVEERIGVYELFENELIERDIYDEDGDIKIEALRQPLYFSYISELLQSKDRKILEEKEAEKAKQVSLEAAEEVSKEKKSTISSDDADKISSSESIKSSAEKSLLEAEKSADFATQEVESVTSKVKYLEQVNSVKEYLTNHNYTLSNVLPDGNCLFAVIRDALSSQKTNEIIKKIHESFSYEHTGDEKKDIQNDINSLRDFLAKRVTEEMYMNYKSLYSAVFEERDKSIELSIIKIQQLKDSKTHIKSKHEQIIEKFKTSKDKEEQSQLKKEADELKKRYTDIIKKEKLELSQLKDLQTVNEELEYLEPLKYIDSFEKFKSYIKSDKFWGESWAISILEEILNIKLILFSEDKLISEKQSIATSGINKNISFDNIIYCGDIINEKFITQGYFNPDLYILVYHDGSHYQLIKYRGQGIFTFDELPREIKNTIKKKCYPNKEGNFYLIKELNDYKIEEPVEITGGKKSLRKTKKFNLNKLNNTLINKKHITRKANNKRKENIKI